MSKKSIYSCQECGAQYGKWVGQCSECGKWNTIIEEVIDRGSYCGIGDKKSGARSSGHAIEVSDLGVEDENILETVRHDTGIKEFNRVIGGGIVDGSVVLFSGEPGIGKSTLLLQLCNSAQDRQFDCYYISGEESMMQVKLRAKRLNIHAKNVKIAALTSISDIITLIRRCKSPSIVIIDSIQTMHSEQINSAPGTVSQVRACTFELIKIAKLSAISIIIVGHVTKDGQIAGPKLLEHMVDTVLNFEGDSMHQYRIVRAIKNRYGSTNEIGIFEMASSGLEEVDNPSELFMSKRGQDVSGSCIFAGIEGSRSLLIEIEALVAPSYLTMPRRAAIGWDANRLAMIIAILNSRFGLNITNKEVYLNIAGGLKIIEPALDLAVVVALISAVRDINIPKDTVFFGEVALSGELRRVIQSDNRINEAIKLGFTRIIMSDDNKKYDYDNIQIIKLRHISELARLFDDIK